MKIYHVAVRTLPYLLRIQAVTLTTLAFGDDVAVCRRLRPRGQPKSGLTLDHISVGEPHSSNDELWGSPETRHMAAASRRLLIKLHCRGAHDNAAAVRKGDAADFRGSQGQ